MKRETWPTWALWLVVVASLGGALFCGTEVILSLRGQTLCHAETCAVVEEFSLFSRPVFSLFAAGYFLLQAWLAAHLARRRPGPSWVLLALASAALGAEAILIGRQFVDYHMHCPFCLTVATFTIISALTIVLVSRRLLVLATILGMALAMVVTPLSIKPLALSATKHIHRGTPTEQWLLIYAPNCPHCHEVLSFCETLPDIDLKLCPKRKALAFLHMLGINGVPVLVVDRGGEKRILVGSGLILAYLKGAEKSQPIEGILAPSGVCEEGKKCEPLHEDLLSPAPSLF